MTTTPNDNPATGSLASASFPATGTARHAHPANDHPVVAYTASAADGTDSLSHQVCDTLGACDTAEVTVTVGTSACTIVGTGGDDMPRGTPIADVNRDGRIPLSAFAAKRFGIPLF